MKVNMKNIYFLIFLVFFAIHSNAQKVVTNSNVNLRSGPTIEEKVVYQIPKGTTIELNGCQDTWCEVTISGHSGFIARQYAGSPEKHYSGEPTQVAHPIGPVNHYTNSRGNVVQSPTHYDAPPSGATAQCRDGTYSFSQNRRGTCSHHGGVAKWLK